MDRIPVTRGHALPRPISRIAFVRDRFAPGRAGKERTVRAGTARATLMLVSLILIASLLEQYSFHQFMIAASIYVVASIMVPRR